MYVGLEGGLLFPRDTNFDVDSLDADEDFDFDIDYKRGIDIDAIAGVDFGGFRLEAEFAHKRAKFNDIVVDGVDFDADDGDLDGRTRVSSVMGNALGDFGTAGFRIYGGGGLGRARVKFSGDGASASDNVWAYQLIAGVGMPIASNTEVGLKYRYFRTGKLDYPFEADGGSVDSRFSSHSLLASLIFGFGAPAEAPYVAPVEVAPAAPPPPATQTCPDGSVILATDMCPAPPPPPPPPPPAPERG